MLIKAAIMMLERILLVTIGLTSIVFSACAPSLLRVARTNQTMSFVNRRTELLPELARSRKIEEDRGTRNGDHATLNGLEQNLNLDSEGFT
jgi:hypothetical protein